MKNLDDLKQSWQSESPIAPERFEEIVTKVQAGSDLLRSTIFRRDMLESIAAVLVVAVFAPGLFVAKNPVAWSGFALLVLVGITIPIVLWRARRRPSETDSDSTFRDFVSVEIDYLTRQTRLLRLVTWWYLLPIYLGIILICLGVTGPRGYSTGEQILVAVYLILCGAFMVYVWRLNQRARTGHLQPLLDYYLAMRNALDSGQDEPMDLSGPPVGFLRPAPAKPLSRRMRWIWITITFFAVVSVVAAGIAISHHFDERTGKFVLSTAPVVAILLIFISGLWRSFGVRRSAGC